jgi:hypothetical protein
LLFFLKFEIAFFFFSVWIANCCLSTTVVTALSCTVVLSKFE